MIIKTLDEILNDPWGLIQKEHCKSLKIPRMFIHSDVLLLQTIKRWEEIYFKPGLIGVYAAYEPYVNYYIIVHLLFPLEKYIELFVGDEQTELLLDRCESFNVKLPYTQVFVDN